MRLRTVLWLGRGSLLLVALWCVSAPAQEARQPAGAAPLSEEAGPREAATQSKEPAAAEGQSSEGKTDVQVQPVGVASPGQEQAGSATPKRIAEEPIVPVPDPLESGPVAIEASSFKGVTPGVTTMAEVEKTWGAPKEISKQNGTVMQLYAVEPFERVEVSYFDKKVASVVIRFSQTFPAKTVVKQLQLTNVRPVLVSNELGEILGQVYPERGVLFAFKPSEKPGTASMSVAQIILEPIGAEPFMLRAETNLDSRYELSLQDVKQALKLQPNSARANWLHARVLVATGDYGKAVRAGGEAVRLEPGNVRYRVTWAQILGQVGRLAEATQEAQKAVQDSERRPHVKARALCLLGDLAASGPKPDYKKAIAFHVQAVQQADPLAKNRHPAIRLAAKEVLVDAHLGAAHDVAWGNWAEKEVAVSRWLAQANAFAEDLIEREGRDQELRFRVSTRALAAYVGVRGKLDPGKWADSAIRTGKELISTTEDPLRKARFQWDLGMALYDALQTYQMRNEHETALKYGEWAIEYLEQGDQKRMSASTTYLLGRLYFRLGAIHAIRDNNHRAAITWFDKALPLLQKHAPGDASGDRGRHGETFVSMGVSYWEAGQREKGVEVTQRGLELMEEAVKQGTLDESVLAVPCSNLASMYRQLGRDEKAEEYEEMATRIKNTKVQ